jgi:hypothetical protein
MMLPRRLWTDDQTVPATVGSTSAAGTPRQHAVGQRRRGIRGASRCLARHRQGVRVGNSKNDAAQNITRGRIRVMGLAKVSIMCLLSVGATNLRLTDTHTQRHERLAAAGPAVPIQRRQPRWRTQLRTEQGARIAAARAARELQDARTGHGPPVAPPGALPGPLPPAG